MKPIGTPPSNASAELMAAWKILQDKDRSEAKLNELYQLLKKASGADKTKIGNLIEAFLADQ